MTDPGPASLCINLFQVALKVPLSAQRLKPTTGRIRLFID